MKTLKKCKDCDKELSFSFYAVRCKSCAGKMRMTDLVKKKYSILHSGESNPFFGKFHSEKTKNEISKSRKGLNCKENHPQWKKDRSTLVLKQKRNDMAYKDWRRNVWERDLFMCKMKNNDCCGRIEAHHILGWKDFPNLRYELNNGITLCHFHHPKKREDEKVLSPYFIKLLTEKK